MRLGRTTHGCTSHIIEESFDTGPIIGYNEILVDAAASVAFNLLNLVEPASELLVRLSVGDTREALFPRCGDGRYFSTPTKKQDQEFRRAGGIWLTSEDERRVEAVLNHHHNNPLYRVLDGQN